MVIAQKYLIMWSYIKVYLIMWSYIKVSWVRRFSHNALLEPNNYKVKQGFTEMYEGCPKSLWTTWISLCKHAEKVY